MEIMRSKNKLPQGINEKEGKILEARKALQLKPDEERKKATS